MEKNNRKKKINKKIMMVKDIYWMRDNNMNLLDNSNLKI